MFLFRVYIALLALVFLLLALFQRGLGILEGSVVTFALLFLILDTRMELQYRNKILRQISSSLDSI